MVRKFSFTPETGKTVYLDPKKGGVGFDNGAEIDSYEFDGSESFKLEIDGWWFDAEGIDELISFLQAAKTQLA